MRRRGMESMGTSGEDVEEVEIDELTVKTEWNGMD